MNALRKLSVGHLSAGRARARPGTAPVAQVSKPAVSQCFQPARRLTFQCGGLVRTPGRLETGDTADWKSALRGAASSCGALALATALFFSPSRAGASLLEYEGFNYTAGTTISGQTGGSGWTNAWAVGGAGNFLGTNTAAGLNYTDANSNALQTTGGSLIVGNPVGTTTTTARAQASWP